MKDPKDMSSNDWAKYNAETERLADQDRARLKAEQEKQRARDAAFDAKQAKNAADVRAKAAGSARSAFRR